jgi:hypothetical protein
MNGELSQSVAQSKGLLIDLYPASSVLEAVLHARSAFVARRGPTPECFQQSL